MEKAAKRVRPRPNQITVDMSDEIRKKLNSMLAYRRLAMSNPLYSASELIRDLIDDPRAIITHGDSKKKLSRNSNN